MTCRRLAERILGLEVNHVEQTTRRNFFELDMPVKKERRSKARGCAQLGDGLTSIGGNISYRMLIWDYSQIQAQQYRILQASSGAQLLIPRQETGTRIKSLLLCEQEFYSLLLR